MYICLCLSNHIVPQCYHKKYRFLQKISSFHHLINGLFILINCKRLLCLLILTYIIISKVSLFVCYSRMMDQRYCRNRWSYVVKIGAKENILAWTKWSLSMATNIPITFWDSKKSKLLQGQVKEKVCV